MLCFIENQSKPSDCHPALPDWGVVKAIAKTPYLIALKALHPKGLYNF
jgi:hypothetical protein